MKYDFLFIKMILDFLQNFQIIQIAKSLLFFIGVALLLYVVAIVCLVLFTLFKSKNLDVIKAIHILSVIDVYAIVCFIIGIIFVAKIYNIVFFKFLLYLIIVIFNGITVTRLVAKTAYFYNLRFKKVSKSEE